MGYANTAVLQRLYYTPSDDVLITDNAEVSTHETVWTTLKTLILRSEIVPTSLFRIKFEYRTGNIAQTAYIRVLKESTVITSVNTNLDAYQAVIYDMVASVDFKSEDHIYIQGYNSHTAVSTYLKNLSICGIGHLFEVV